MGEEEVKWWLRELIERHGWPVSCLGRTLGLSQGYKGQVRSKMDGRSWIYETERIRMSYVLKRIISGELVPKPLRTPGGRMRWEAVIADHPQPLRLPIQWHINLARKDPFEWRVEEPPPPALPNFRTLLDNPREFRMRKSWPWREYPRRKIG
jgi:hypothetical protein